MGRYVTVDTQVEVDLDEFDTDDLIEELVSRGLDYNTNGVDADEIHYLLEAIWLSRRRGLDYQRELDKLIWGVLGKLV
jgi:hypothetical protein